MVNIIGKVVVDGKAMRKCLDIVSQGLTASGIKKRADARRHARLLDAQTDVDIRAIEDGVAAYQEENLRAIGQEALPLLEAAGNPTIADRDWLVCWLESARNASDEDLQKMWARILSGKAENESRFSKWTLHAVSQMSKADIENWTRLASCLWEFNGPDDTVACYWLQSSGKILRVNERMLTNGSLATFHGSYAINYREVVKRAPIGLRYFGQWVVLEISEKREMHVPTGHVTLTPTAKEVLSLCDAKPNVEYQRDCFQHWTEAGIKVLGSVGA